MRFVDLTAPITQSPADLPDVLRTDIEFHDHAGGAAQIEALLGVPARLLRDGEGWATETFTRFGTHNSTHVDAPWHYNSRIGGEPARDDRRAPARLVLLRRRRARHDREGRRRARSTCADVEAELERIGHELASSTSCWCAPGATPIRRARLHGARARR